MCPFRLIVGTRPDSGSQPLQFLLDGSSFVGNGEQRIRLGRRVMVDPGITKCGDQKVPCFRSIFYGGFDVVVGLQAR